MAKANKKPDIVDRSKELVVNAKRRKSAKDGLPCVMFLKGSEKGGVLLAPRGKPIPKAEILEQRKPFKGGPLFRGVCYGVDGGLAFDLFADPDRNRLPAGPKLKKVINGFLETKYKNIQARLVPVSQMGDLAADFGDLMDDLDDAADTAEIGDEHVMDSPAGAAEQPETPDGQPDANQAKQLSDTLNKLTPLVKKALKQSPASKDELLAGIKAASDAIKAGNLGDARKLVKALGTKLQAILSGETSDTGEYPDESDSGSDSPAPSHDEAEFIQRFEPLESRAQELIRAQTGDVSGMRAVLAYIYEAAESKAFGKALVALRRLETLITSSDSGEGEGYQAPATVPGIVAYRQALLKFNTTFRQVRGRIETLRGRIEDTLPDEADLAEAVEERLSDLTDELMDAVDVALGESRNVQHPVNQATIDQISSFKDKLATDDLIAHVDGNPFVPTNIASDLTRALNQIETSLPG